MFWCCMNNKLNTFPGDRQREQKLLNMYYLQGIKLNLKDQNLWNELETFCGNFIPFLYLLYDETVAHHAYKAVASYYGALQWDAKPEFLIQDIEMYTSSEWQTGQNYITNLAYPTVDKNYISWSELFKRFIGKAINYDDYKEVYKLFDKNTAYTFNGGIFINRLTTAIRQEVKDNNVYLICDGAAYDLVLDIDVYKLYLQKRELY